MINDLFFAASKMPRMSAHIPGCGGIFKSGDEDFCVEEIPAYEPSGEGDHVYLWIEKKNLTTPSLLDEISRHTGIPVRDLGVAGMKDKIGITRQYVSVRADKVDMDWNFSGEKFKVLHWARHGNKLKTGHLRGNRFLLWLRGVGADAEQRCAEIAQHIRTVGFPNFYGSQRFGYDGNTIREGLLALQGASKRHPDKRQYRMAISSVQSALFNVCLSERMRAGTLNVVQAGDALQRHAGRSAFLCEDPAHDQTRLDQGELCVTGPMLGPKMLMTEGETAAQEASVYERFGMDVDMFARIGSIAEGTRRPYVVIPEELDVSMDGEDLRLCFSLPSGGYASVLVREFQGDA